MQYNILRKLNVTMLNAMKNAVANASVDLYE